METWDERIRRKYKTQRVIFGYTWFRIEQGVSISIALQVWAWEFITSHFVTIALLVEFVYLILCMIVIGQIVQTEKKFKRFSGHYSIKPPKGFYD